VSALSFREQAAIAIYTSAQCLKKEAVASAQNLADECCEQMGHEPWPVVPYDHRVWRTGPEALKTDQLYCRRCGVDLP